MRTFWSTFIATLLLGVTAATADESVVKAVEPASFSVADTSCAETCIAPTCQSPCNCAGGWFAGSELTLFTPHTGSINIPIAAPVLPGGALIPERNLGVGGRYWLGYRAESGLGIRTRFWNFTQGTSFTSIGPAALPPGSTLSTNANAWDAEVTQLLNRGRFSFDISGGVRWAELTDTVGPLLSESFNGWGSTVAVLARRQLGCGPISLVGGARGSLLYGSHNLSLASLPINSTQEVLPVFETQLGAEYGKQLKSGKIAFARAALETQLWELPPTVIGLFDQNIGLVGVSLGGGIRY